MEQAQVLTADQTGVKLSSVWSPSFGEHEPFDLARAKREFRETLEQAVKREVSEAPIGAYLSGGTDSSTVVGTLRKATGHPPATFSIGFGHADYDEMSYARLAARHFAADHHELYVTPAHLVENFATIAGAYDQPFGNSSALPAFLCAQMARSAGDREVACRRWRR